jgi:hypothetical protein
MAGNVVTHNYDGYTEENSYAKLSGSDCEDWRCFGVVCGKFWCNVKKMQKDLVYRNDLECYGKDLALIS